VTGPHGTFRRPLTRPVRGRCYTIRCLLGATALSMPYISYSFHYEGLVTAYAATKPYSKPRRVEEMTTSPRWRSVLASAATAAALVVAPLAAAGTAHATDDPYPTHSTDHPYPPKPDDGTYPPKPDHGTYPPKPDHGTYPPKPDHGTYPPKPDHGTYPPKPPKPHYPDKPHGEHGQYPDKPHGEHGQYPDKPHGENGHHPDKPELAHTGDNNRELILGGVAASLVAAGVGTLVVVRRRHNS